MKRYYQPKWFLAFLVFVLLSSCVSDQKKDVKKLLEQAIELGENGNYKEANKILKEAIRQYPESEEAEEMQHEIVFSFYSPLNFAVTDEVKGRKVDPDEAIKEAKIYLKKYPKGEYASEVQLFIAFVYGYEKKDYIKAIQELDKLIQNYSEDEPFVSGGDSLKARFQNELRRTESEKIKLQD